MFECPYCGTDENKNGVKFKSQGSLNLHIKKCKEKEEEVEEIEMVEEVEEVVEKVGNICPECKGKLKRLNPKVKWCQKPLAEGYTKICEPCEVVYE